MSGNGRVVRTLVLVFVLVLAAGPMLASGAQEGPNNLEPVAPDAVQADTTVVIPIQGRLTDANGPINGVRTITVGLYTVATGGAPICSQTAAITLTAGLFTFRLTTCSTGVINGRQLWAGIKVASDPEMTPRQPLDAVPYAASLVPGTNVVGTETNWNMIYADNMATTSASYGVRALSRSPDGRGLSGENYAATTGVGVFGQAFGSQGVGVIGTTAAAPTSVVGAGVVGMKSGYSLGDKPGGNWGPGGLFMGGNGVIGLTKTDGGYGVYGVNNAPTTGSGWAGLFTAAHGNGVWIGSPAGTTALVVSGGTKNAAVATADGARLMYSEEATEVKFTDYGFGRLVDGKATVAMDATFAQTVDLTQPYHVFVEPYGDAALYVIDRTPAGFTVRLHDGDANVEFSYRVVATRAGYAGKRLERFPQADNDPSLFPEKQGQAGANRQ